MTISFKVLSGQPCDQRLTEAFPEGGNDTCTENLSSHLHAPIPATRPSHLGQDSQGKLKPGLSWCFEPPAQLRGGYKAQPHLFSLAGLCQTCTLWLQWCGEEEEEKTSPKTSQIAKQGPQTLCAQQAQLCLQEGKYLPGNSVLGKEGSEDPQGY